MRMGFLVNVSARLPIRDYGWLTARKINKMSNRRVSYIVSQIDRPYSELGVIGDIRDKRIL